MNRNNLWKFVFVLAVIFWSFYEMYPPMSGDMAQEFKKQAIRTDAAYTNIVERLDKLQKDKPDRSSFANLVDAVGTNDITRYFPEYDVKGEMNPTRAVLDQMQRAAA